ncbi:hypothetical protein ACFOWE_14865 [Planomonospora corallina]|uniref:Tat pathway signal sequence domain protein n=1 Tax=Planomonospora corallina TaxID=1806052 RepID=A0ABV8I5V0_9ACTN
MRNPWNHIEGVPMEIFRKKAVATALGVVTAASMLTADAVAAETAPDVAKICGAGFRKVADREVVDYEPGSRVLGKVHLLHRKRTGEYCAVTVKSAAPGKPAAMRVGLGSITGTRFDMEEMAGRYKSHIGPLTKKMKMQPKVRCIRFSGTIQISGQGSVTNEGNYGPCPGGGTPKRKTVRRPPRGR